MQINYLTKAAPTISGVDSRPKFNRVRWEKSRDPEHVRMALFRYTSSANAIADTSATLVDDEIRGIQYKDADGLTLQADYWYRIASIDVWGNQSAKSGIVTTKFKGIQDVDIDPEAAGTPTGVSVTAGAIARQDDGTILAHAMMSWTAPASGAPVKFYRVRVRHVTSNEVRWFESALTSLPIRVETGKSYEYQVQAVSSFGQASSLTTAVAYTRPKKVGDVPNVGTVTATGLKKRIKLDWVDIDDDAYPDYRMTYIYRNTVNTVPTLGTTTPYKKVKQGQFVDDNVTTGTSYYYWVVHKDNSGNFGAISGTIGPVSSGGNEVTAFSDLTGAATSAQLAAGRGVNLLFNPDARLGLAFFKEGYDEDNDSTFTLRNDGTWNLNTGPVFEISKPTAGVGVTDIYPTDEYGVNAKIPVVAGKRYEFHMRAGVHRCTALLAVQFFNSSGQIIDAAGNPNNYWQQSTFFSGLAGGRKLADYQLNGLFALAPPNASYALPIIRKHGTTAGQTNSFLFYTQLFFGEAGANQTEFSPWSYTGQGITTSTMTDQTAPVTPTGLAVGAGSLERMDDGTIEAQADVTWNAVTTGVPFTHYRVKQTQVSNSKIRFFDVPAGTLIASVPVKTGKSYNYQVTTVTFNNKEGAYSSAVSYTRAKKTGDMPNVGTVTATGLKKRIKIDWVDIDDDTYPDYRMTYIYRNTSNTPPTLGTTTPHKKTKQGQFVDENVANATNYYYWVVHKDRSGNFGALSSVVGPVQSGGGEVTSFADLTGSIAGGQIPNEVIDTPMIAPEAVVASKIYSFGQVNIMPDTELYERDLWHFQESPDLNLANYVELAPANAVRSLNPTADGRGYSDYKYRLTGTTNDRHIIIRNNSNIPVEEGQWLKVSGVVENLGGSSGHNIANATVIFRWYRLDNTGALEHVSTTGFTTGFAIAFGARATVERTIIVPSGVNVAQVQIAIPGNAGVTRDIYFSSPSARILIPTGDVHRRDLTLNAGATGSFGTARNVLAEVTVPANFRSPLHSTVYQEFKNISGNAKTFTVELLMKALVGDPWTVMDSIVLTVGDDQLMKKNWFITGTSSERIYALAVQGAAASNNVNNALIAIETVYA